MYDLMNITREVFALNDIRKRKGEREKEKNEREDDEEIWLSS